MIDFLDAAIKANKEILDVIKNNTHEFLCEDISLGFGGDVSKRVDIIAEDIFIKHLEVFGDILTEERGLVEGDGEFNLIIDPIDGSNNFASNIPYFGTSVALKKGNDRVASVITNLATKEIFYKENKKFQKAKLDNLIFKGVVANRCSSIGIFERSYCSDFAYDILKSQKIKFRSLGAFALSLAYAREVDFVIYEGKRRVYDVEAGLHMCEDLYILEEDDFLLISKDKEIFAKISQLFKKREN